MLSAISSSGVRADPAALLEQLNKEKIIAVTPQSPFINDRFSAQPSATPAPPVEVQSKASESAAKREEVARLKAYTDRGGPENASPYRGTTPLTIDAVHNAGPSGCDFTRSRQQVTKECGD